MNPRVALASAAMMATLVLAGCGGGATTADDSTTAPPSSSPSTSAPSKASAAPSAEQDATDVSITVTGRDVTPAPGRIKVPVDGKVRLTVTSDVANELHIHGIDKYVDLAAGEPTTVTFRMPQSGLFELETHEDPVLLLAQLQVQ